MLRWTGGSSQPDSMSPDLALMCQVMARLAYKDSRYEALKPRQQRRCVRMAKSWLADREQLQLGPMPPSVRAALDEIQAVATASWAASGGPGRDYQLVAPEPLV